MGNGRFLGASTTLEGMLSVFVGGYKRGEIFWRVVFLGGVVGGSYWLSETAAGGVDFAKGAFERLPSTYTEQRAALAGGLVGLGASLAGGSTLTHGLSGLSVGGVRGGLATAVMIAAGAAAASSTGAAAALGVDEKKGTALTSPAMPRSVQEWTWLGTIIVVPALFVFASLRGAAHAATALERAKKTAFFLKHGPKRTESLIRRGWKVNELFGEFFAGALTMFALGATGVTHPSKVVAFLSFASPAWDPTVGLAMATAAAVAAPLGLWALGPRWLATRPAFREAFALPSKTDVDPFLILGAALFGAGWGTGGLSPVTAIANVSQCAENPQMLTFLQYMVAGIMLRLLGAKLASRAAGLIRGKAPLASTGRISSAAAPGLRERR
ncbi:unnamed protein product [Pedinophyceae sp. YPF-701]|nr:unnamed protein product [Pedinophyceae sp. YPF-701]